MNSKRVLGFLLAASLIFGSIGGLMPVNADDGLYTIELGEIIRAPGDTESTILIDQSPAAEGTEVKLTVVPQENMRLRIFDGKSSIKVRASGSTVGFREEESNIYTYIMRASDAVVTAEFEELPVYTVDFNSNYEETIDPIEVHLGGRIKLPRLERELHIFDGWFTDDESFKEEFTEEIIVDSDISLYAKWIPLFTVTLGEIKRVPGDTESTIEIDQSPVLAGTKITFTIKPKEGMRLKNRNQYSTFSVYEEGGRFGGGSNHGALKQDENTFTYDAKGLSHMVVTAEFEAKIPYTVKFARVDYADGSWEDIDPIIGYSGERIILPQPEQERHEFVGWFTDDGTFEKEFTNRSLLASNITLYPKWIKPEFRVLLNITRPVGDTESTIVLSRKLVDKGDEISFRAQPKDGMMLQIRDGLYSGLKIYEMNLVEGPLSQFFEAKSPGKEIFSYTLGGWDDVYISASFVDIPVSIGNPNVDKPEDTNDYDDYYEPRPPRENSNPIEKEIIAEKPIEEVVDIPKENILKDIQGHWAEESINKLAALNVVSGDNGNYHPNKQMSRGEFVTLLVKAFELKAKETILFNDVAEDKWYYEAVNIAASNGIVVGLDNNFLPDKNISREEMVIILMRLLNLKIPNQPIPSIYTTYLDEAEISQWATSTIQSASALGLVQGHDGKFNPKSQATQAESAAVIVRLLDLLK